MDKELKHGLIQMVVVTLLLVILVVTLGLLYREPLEAFGHRTIDLLGYTGIGLGVLIADMFTFIIPPDFYLFVAVTADLTPWLVIAVGSLGSILGGLGAYQIGRLLHHTRFVQRMMKPIRDRGDAFVDRAGLATVIAAALTPIPFSLTCMAAGSVQMNFRLFFYATLFRIPRIAGYFMLIRLGWMA
jgi:membrane protein YqaA with SNARE-associated domain